MKSIEAPEEPETKMTLPEVFELTEDNKVHNLLRVSAVCHQGGRKYMEDYYTVAYQENKSKTGLEYAFFGIFDGHGGREAAAFAKENLMNNIVREANFWSNDDNLVLKAIKEGFMQTHYGMLKEVGKWPKTASGLPSTSGTTASVCFLKNNKLYTGHVGDSKIVLARKNEETGMWIPMSLTQDHKPDSVEEKQRIQSAGGQVMSKSGVERVVWNRPKLGHKGPIRRSTSFDMIPFLAVARSLGDLWSYNSALNTFIVSPEPDVSVVELDLTRDKAIVLASDGLWNMMVAYETIRLVQELEEPIDADILNSLYAPNPYASKPTNPARSLVQLALQRWFQQRLRADNTSVITVLLDKFDPNDDTKCKFNDPNAEIDISPPVLDQDEEFITGMISKNDGNDDPPHPFNERSSSDESESDESSAQDSVPEVFAELKKEIDNENKLKDECPILRALPKAVYLSNSRYECEYLVNPIHPPKPKQNYLGLSSYNRFDHQYDDPYDSFARFSTPGLESTFSFVHDADWKGSSSDWVSEKKEGFTMIKPRMLKESTSKKDVAVSFHGPEPIWMSASDQFALQEGNNIENISRVVNRVGGCFGTDAPARAPLKDTSCSSGVDTNKPQEKNETLSDKAPNSDEDEPVTKARKSLVTNNETLSSREAELQSQEISSTLRMASDTEVQGDDVRSGKVRVLKKRRYHSTSSLHAAQSSAEAEQDQDINLPPAKHLRSNSNWLRRSMRRTFNASRRFKCSLSSKLTIRTRQQARYAVKS